MAKTVKLKDVSDELEKLLTDFLHTSFEKRQEALQAGAEVFRDAVAASTPVDTGEMAKSWRIKKKYKDRRYVGNTRVAHGVVHRKNKDGTRGEAREGVPLSNILEYAENSKYRDFVDKCFQSTEPQIYAAIKNKLDGD